MPQPTLTSPSPPVTFVLILLSLSLALLSITSNCNALALAHTVSCPCSLVVKASHDAPAFLVAASSSSSRRRTLRTEPTRLTPRLRRGGTRSQYFRALIADKGDFNITLVPVHTHDHVSSRTHQIISWRTTTRPDTSAAVAPHTCPVLFPQDPPMRFETRPVSQKTDASTSLSMETHIVGGYEAGEEINKYTALINLDPNRWNSSCSGTLIGRSTVLTAAHCAVTLNSVVYFGFVDKTNPGTKRTISEIRTHPLYNSSSVYNGQSSYDMLFIMLSSPAPKSARAMRVNFNPSIPLTSSIVRVGGYGRLNMNAPLPQALHQVDLKVLSSRECFDKFDQRNGYVQVEQVFCAVAIDGADCSPCQADSGGPVWQYDDNDEPVLVGIISRGDKCSTKYIPTLSVRISASYMFTPKDELVWVNSTATLIVSGNLTNPIVTAGPSPSYKPLPSHTATSSSSGTAGSAAGASSTGTLTIVFGSFAGVLLFGAIIIGATAYARR